MFRMLGRYRSSRSALLAKNIKEDSWKKFLGALPQVGKSSWERCPKSFAFQRRKIEDNTLQMHKTNVLYLPLSTWQAELAKVK